MQPEEFTETIMLMRVIHNQPFVMLAAHTNCLWREGSELHYNRGKYADKGRDGGFYRLTRG